MGGLARAPPLLTPALDAATKSFLMLKTTLSVTMILCLSSVFTRAWGAPPASSFAKFDQLKGTLDIAGGTAHIPVMQEAAKKIQNHNKAIKIQIGAGGSGIGVQKLAHGLIDIGNTGRPLSAHEQSTYKLKSYAFAVDGIALIVHPSHPLKNLSSQMAKKIFLGEQQKWEHSGKSIHVFIRDEASGTREVFAEKLLGKNIQSKGSKVVTSNGAMKQAIANDPLAIGYMSIGHLDSSVRGLRLDNKEATQEHAVSGFYPVSRKLFMNTSQQPSALALAFIDFIYSPEMGEVIKSLGLVPIARAQ